MIVTHLNKRTTWSQDDLNRLPLLANNDLSYREMSKIIPHTPGSIELKMSELKIPYTYRPGKITLCRDHLLTASRVMPKSHGKPVNYAY